MSEQKDSYSGFDLFIDALGARSPLSTKNIKEISYGALWTSLNWPSDSSLSEHGLTQRYRKASKMAGILPIGRLPENSNPVATFFWSLKTSDYTAWKAKPIETWKEEARKFWPELDPFLAQIKGHDDLTFARYRHRTLSTPIDTFQGIPLLHIGDSYHATSPQLGQGANMALLDAAALNKALDITDDIPKALKKFKSLRHTHIRFYQTLSWVFTPLYQSDLDIFAWLRDWLGAPFLALPIVRDYLPHMLAGHWLLRRKRFLHKNTQNQPK